MDTENEFKGLKINWKDFYHRWKTTEKGRLKKLTLLVFLPDSNDTSTLLCAQLAVDNVAMGGGHGGQAHVAY